MKIPSIAGEVGEAIQVAVIHLLFARVWRTDQSGRPDLLAVANSQLRDSAGITPASPLADRI